jgi:Flp pilus assembly protein TadG
LAIIVRVVQEKAIFKEVTKAMAKKKARKAQRGIALMKAALTMLPRFFFAIMEGGRFFKVQQTLAGIAREGARLGTVPLSQTDILATKPEIVEVIKLYCSLITLSVFSSLKFTLNGEALMRDETTA